MNDPRRGLPSCSALARLDACPASFLLAKEAEAAGAAPPPDPWTTSGQKIHKWLETEDDADFEALTHDERETANRCYDQRERLIAEWSGSVTLDHFRERRLGLTRMGTSIDVTDATTAELVCTGMADHTVIDKPIRSGIIMDYKCLPGDVDDAADNAQLRGLAVLAAGRWNLKSGRVAVIQPLCGAPTVADFDEQSLADAEVWLEDVCERVHQPSEPKAGRWCRYCPAQLICPAFKAAAAAPLACVGSLPPGNERAAMTARLHEFSGADLAALLGDPRLKMAEWLRDSAKKVAVDRLMRDAGGVPGWELRDKNGRRKIADTDKAATAVSPLLTGAAGGAQAALLRAATLRPKALQEEIQFASGKKSARLYNMTQKDAKAALAAALGDLMEAPTHKELVETGAVLTDGEEGG